MAYGFWAHPFRAERAEIRADDRFLRHEIRRDERLAFSDPYLFPHSNACGPRFESPHQGFGGGGGLFHQC